MQKLALFTVLFIFIFYPTVAKADMVWPALYLEKRLLSWWAICAGLLIEFFFIKHLFLLSPKRALLINVGANTASTIVGIILIPLTGFIWEIFIHDSNSPTFNPITWIFTFLSACFLNALIEGLIIKKLFKIEFEFAGQKLMWLIFANTFSVGIALISLWIEPLKP